MNQFYRPFISTLPAWLFIITFSSCGTASNPDMFKKNPAGTTNVNTSSAGGCNRSHKMPGRTVVWSFSHCSSIETLHIEQNTENSKKEKLGDRPVNRGMISFRITGMSNNKVTARETFGIMFMGNGNGNREVNWQWMSYNVGGGNIQSRIIVQRFDGTCPNFCEHSVITDDLQFRDEADVFQFDCRWDTDAREIACDITKPSDKNYKVQVINQPLGAYNSLRYIGMGRNAFQGSYPGYDGTLSDIIVTIFD